MNKLFTSGKGADNMVSVVVAITMIITIKLRSPLRLRIVVDAKNNVEIPIDFICTKPNRKQHFTFVNHLWSINEDSSPRHWMKMTRSYSRKGFYQNINHAIMVIKMTTFIVPTIHQIENFCSFSSDSSFPLQPAYIIPSKNLPWTSILKKSSPSVR